MPQISTYSTTQSELYCAPVDNTGLDPMQGFDFFVWVADVCTGKLAWFGAFQSLTLSIRDATETYLELGQRIPIHLNGEIQIAWVLEQGLVDYQFIYRTFGVKAIRRDMYISRGPRFQISFDGNAYELDRSANQQGLTGTGMVANGTVDRGNSGNNIGDDTLYRWGSDEYLHLSADMYASDTNYRPIRSGRYDILRCKVDSVSLGIMPGRRVAAVRWEGVAEGIAYINETVQQFKTQRDTGTSGGFMGELGIEDIQIAQVTGRVVGGGGTNTNVDSLNSTLAGGGG